MKIALLSGAYKNSGDFLIVQRSKELLQYVFPNSDITEISRRDSLNDKIDFLNQHDIIVLAGGPGYIPNVYPNVIPLVTNLDTLKPKIFILGMGWYGHDDTNATIANYKFTAKSKELFNRVNNDGFSLGCRDLESLRILKNNGFNNITMTGCPAWYNLDYVKKPVSIQCFQNSVQKICVSDPADIRNFDLAYDLLKYLKAKYTKAEITFVYHRGIAKDDYTNAKVARSNELFLNKLKELNIKYVDIAYSSEGFQIYNDCDLHIGFRVHAHIYNMSIRNKSILIEEDGRGAGVNAALGLKRITAYNDNLIFKTPLLNKVANRVSSRRNKDFIFQIDDYLFELANTNYLTLIHAYSKMDSYFEYMIDHIKSIEKY